MSLPFSPSLPGRLSLIPGPSKAGLTLGLVPTYPGRTGEANKYPFLEQKADFTCVPAHTVITALSKVRAECNKVTTMSLPLELSKYSRLEEFEQIQSQTFSQVRGHPGGRKAAWPGPRSHWTQTGALGSLGAHQLRAPASLKPGLASSCDLAGRSGGHQGGCGSSQKRISRLGTFSSRVRPTLEASEADSWPWKGTPYTPVST